MTGIKEYSGNTTMIRWGIILIRKLTRNSIAKPFVHNRQAGLFLGNPAN